MSNISLTFVAHQPNRLIHYDFFKIGEHAFYEDDDLNARVLSTVAERCYFPATRLMKQLIELTGGKFRFGLALSGVILEQALYHRPDLIAAFKDLAETGCVDFLAMPYYNSLASVYSPQEFAEQIEEHRELLKTLSSGNGCADEYRHAVLQRHCGAGGNARLQGHHGGRQPGHAQGIYQQ